jgi:hypothetical protein
MPEATCPGRHELLSNALEHLRLALHLLDEADAPAEIGARIDFVIHELYLVIARLTARDAFTQIDRNADPQ